MHCCGRADRCVALLLLWYYVVMSLIVSQPEAEGQTSQEIANAWRDTISRRLNEVRIGEVELISAEESERRIDAIIAKHRR